MTDIRQLLAQLNTAVTEHVPDTEKRVHVTTDPDEAARLEVEGGHPVMLIALVKPDPTNQPSESHQAAIEPPPMPAYTLADPEPPAAPERPPRDPIPEPVPDDELDGTGDYWAAVRGKPSDSFGNKKPALRKRRPKEDNFNKPLDYRRG